MGLAKLMGTAHDQTELCEGHNDNYNVMLLFVPSVCYAGEADHCIMLRHKHIWMIPQLPNIGTLRKRKGK